MMQATAEKETWVKTLTRILAAATDPKRPLNIVRIFFTPRGLFFAATNMTVIAVRGLGKNAEYAITEERALTTTPDEIQRALAAVKLCRPKTKIAFTLLYDEKNIAVSLNHSEHVSRRIHVIEQNILHGMNPNSLCRLFERYLEEDNRSVIISISRDMLQTLLKGLKTNDSLQLYLSDDMADKSFLARTDGDELALGVSLSNSQNIEIRSRGPKDADITVDKDLISTLARIEMQYAD